MSCHIFSQQWKILLQEQYHEEDQKVWLTTALTGLPTAPDEEELKSVRDIQLGRHTDRHLHPVISVFILKIQEEISTQCQNWSPSSEKIRVIEIEKEHSGHTHGWLWVRYRDQRRYSLGTGPSPPDGKTPTKNHSIEHENPDDGRGPRSILTKRGE